MTQIQDYADRRKGNNFTLLVIFKDDKAMKVYMDHDEHTAVNYLFFIPCPLSNFYIHNMLRFCDYCVMIIL